MKVLLFSNLFPNPTDPQRGVFTFQLAKALAEYCELCIVTPLPWFPNIPALKSLHQWYQFSQIPRKYEIGGFDVYSPKYLMLPKVSAYTQHVFMRFGSNRLVTELNNEMHFDVINSHWLYPDSLAMAPIANRLGLAHVATALGCDVNLTFTDPRKHKLIKRSIEDFDGVTTVSSEMRSKLIASGAAPERVKVILNGVDGEKFPLKNKALCRAKLGIDFDGAITLYVGRLSDEKGINYLLEGFVKAQSTKDIGCLYLVGDGELRASLEGLVRELNLSHRVRFIGVVPHSEISVWLGAADYLCLPSKREGCPNVVLEALSTGTPVIASRVGAIPDLLTEANGLLCEPENSSAFANGLLAAQSVQWDANKIRHSVSHLTWAAIAKSYIDFYQVACRVNKKATT